MVAETSLLPGKRQRKQRADLGQPQKKKKKIDGEDFEEGKKEDSSNSDEDRLTIDKEDITKSRKKNISQILKATTTEDSTGLLRQILARLELLRQEHKRTERQIQFIIDTAKETDTTLFEQAQTSRTEIHAHSSLTGELILNIQAFNNIFQND